MTATLPPKRTGDHRWIAVASHALTAGQAAAAAAGSAVRMGEHNLIGIAVGCVDCESEWPSPQPCPADAAPELDDVTAEWTPADAVLAQVEALGGDGALTEEDLNRVVAAVDAVGRSGGRSIEIGYQDEDAPAALARWYATAAYRGARVSADEHSSPADAAEALAWRVLEDGACTRCKRTIGIVGHASGKVPNRCAWDRHTACWVPGCVEEADVAAYVASRVGEGL